MAARWPRKFIESARSYYSFREKHHRTTITLTDWPGNVCPGRFTWRDAKRILLLTDNNSRIHRFWIEYRYADDGGCLGLWQQRLTDRASDTRSWCSRLAAIISRRWLSSESSDGSSLYVLRSLRQRLLLFVLLLLLLWLRIRKHAKDKLQFRHHRIENNTPTTFRESWLNAIGNERDNGTKGD